MESSSGLSNDEWIELARKSLETKRTVQEAELQPDAIKPVKLLLEFLGTGGLLNETPTKGSFAPYQLSQKDIMACPNCNTPQRLHILGTRGCVVCGHGAILICKHCKSKVPYLASFCGRCGNEMPKRGRGLRDERVKVWRDWFNSIGWGTERDPRFFERIAWTQVGQSVQSVATEEIDISDLDIDLVVEHYEPVLFWLSASDINWWPYRFHLSAQVDMPPVNWIYATSWRLFIFFHSQPFLAVWRYEHLRSVQTEGETTLSFVTKDNQKLYILFRSGRPKGLAGLGKMSHKTFMGRLKDFSGELTMLGHDL